MLRCTRIVPRSTLESVSALTLTDRRLKSISHQHSRVVDKRTVGDVALGNLTIFWIDLGG